ncbi:histidine phosphatase family protein [Ideonella livida]|uniref:Alpha-ribazole phosphatase n=1 Tax=Ideonella livida TaxID=2707176 RepID=A0A7C9TKG5_9BURK|nr:histidine phosphatase family protein [Ideonella livida]NDY91305.1 alpha-ribazole phosphatase [Ideonella livida]
MSEPEAGLDLLLLRHPPVALPPGHCYGWLDVPLAPPATQTLVAAVARVQARLQAWGLRPACVVSSPSSRCLDLARALAATPECAGSGPALAVRVDARWRELHFGRWEGRRWDDIPRHESDPWAEDVHHRAPPEGETRAALLARVQDALQALRRQPGPCLVVAHAGPLRAVLAQALGQPPGQVPDMPLDCAHLSWLRWPAHAAHPQALQLNQ